MTMKLVQTLTVPAGGANLINFTNIPQDGTDLLLLTSLRLNSTTSRALIRLNNNSSLVYTNISLFGNGTSASAISDANPTFIGLPVGQSDQTANTFSNSSSYFSDYTSLVSKSILIEGLNENNASSGLIWCVASYSTATSTIASLEISTASLFIENSTASLYKITKGSDGTTVVT